MSRMMNDLVVRKARVADAKELAQLAEKTFRDTFASQNTLEDMDHHCRLKYGERIQEEEITDPKMITLVCELEKTLVGFGQIRFNTAPDCVLANKPAEIQRLYVQRECHGKGVGQELMMECISEIKLHMSDVIWLGVWEHNPRAIAFYKKIGFSEVGAHVFQLGSDPQRDIVMAKSIKDF